VSNAAPRGGGVKPDPIPDRLKRLYLNRFAENRAYRNRVWEMLARELFSRWVPADAAVLDLGAGYGEFINNARASRKYAMDLNPDSKDRVSADVTFFHHDCATPWPLGPEELDVVFTSNFFEHLPDKAALAATILEAWRCLRPGGRLIALGPNIRYLPGRYWDFFDHHIPLSDASLGEVLMISGFELETVIDRFLPYTMVGGPEYPLALLRLYLAMPWAWRLFGRQFLLVARKSGPG
jgi:SAM-dependent methyltransferase